MTQAITDHIMHSDYSRPTLVLDIAQVRENYLALARGMPDAHIHYAVKANPHPAVLRCLVDMGCGFDAASMAEIDMCLAAGATADSISFGNTIKRVEDIQHAVRQGISLFAADAEEELEKLARHAPGSRIYIRILTHSAEAEWPLSRKFGCSSSYAVPLLDLARDLGLRPVGLSFHVGSQTRHPHMWMDSLDHVAAVWQHARDEGHELWLLNIGGGFPARYGADITDAETYGRAIAEAVQQRFDGVTYVMAEPGRGLVGDAGAISAEVLLVSRKTQGDPVRWVYLDIGRFSGLAETEGEAIKYQFSVPARQHSAVSGCVVAGPTCDSADVLYERNLVELPVDLSAGDRVIIHACGAYTSTYSTVAFNGFPALAVTALGK
jgi:ornithine decarboxylase